MEAEDEEVFENGATELRCVVTLSNPDGEVVNATIGKTNSSGFLTSARLG